MAIAVDANRDGDIVFEGDSADTTSGEKPFRFWINDDDDGRTNEEVEIVPPADEDHADGTVQTMRDLEDFAPFIYVLMDFMNSWPMARLESD